MRRHQHGETRIRMIFSQKSVEGGLLHVEMERVRCFVGQWILRSGLASPKAACGGNWGNSNEEANCFALHSFGNPFLEESSKFVLAPRHLVAVFADCRPPGARNTLAAFTPYVSLHPL